MGCDIHLFTERQIFPVSGESFWWCTDFFTLNPYYQFDKVNETEYDHHEIWGDRNYSAFEILADVRSCGHEIVLDQPRGLPHDVSDCVKSQSENWGIDGHSHSWFTAKELFDYDKKYPNSAIAPLVKKIKKKMKKDFNIWGFLSKEEQKQMLKQHAEDFRIVFWFDN